MRYDFGKVYKEIRESKGLTQEEVCGNVLSRTSLSKFESGYHEKKIRKVILSIVGRI